MLNLRTILIVLLALVLSAVSILQEADALVLTNGKTWLNSDFVECAGNTKWLYDCPDSHYIHQQKPVIAFTDIISGSDTGLGDGLGSGAIVTVWGQRLGSIQGTSTIQYCDSVGTCRNGHVYYWKNADGQLPSGPANLYESHGMQEIAFSIPDSADGLGQIRITTSEGTVNTPFTVRAGNIYHVKSNGNDTTGDGSFNNPWLTVGKADDASVSGSTVYLHGIIAGDQNQDMVLYSNNAATDSSLAAQFGYIAYPNTQPEIIGARAVNNYNGTKGIDGLVYSKLSIFAAESNTDANDLPIDNPNNPQNGITFGIYGSKDGRAVGNFITDTHPSDLDGACPDGQQAAIVGNADGRNQIENWKVFGNHIKDYGCSGTNRQHHTTYFTIRSGDENLQLVAPEVAYNYLQDNTASGGLHYFDEDHTTIDCGSFITPFKVHDNVIINQSGPAIANYAKCPTTGTFEYYNNIAINSGYYPPNNALLADNTAKLSNFMAVQIGQSTGAEASTATLNFYNNTFIGWNDSDQTGTVQSCIGFGGAEGTLTINWNNNICITDKDKPFVQSDYQGTFLESRIAGSNNVWYSSATSPTLAVTPSWDSQAVTTDPDLIITGSRVSLGVGSSAIDKVSGLKSVDIYGTKRDRTKSNLGAVEEHPDTGSLLFSENFDAQPDWFNATKTTVGSLPVNWDDARASEAWHPSVEAGTQPAMQINGNNPDQVYGGTGKSFVFYNESYDSNNWNSDGLLVKDINPVSEIYIKFKIKFQSGFATTSDGQIKLFRVLSYDNSGDRFAFFSGGNSSPIYIYDWAQSATYGLRHFHSFRCDDQSSNYYCTNPAILNPPRSIVTGDMSSNYTSDIASLAPQIPDLMNGGNIPTSGSVYHNQILGDVWHTVEFHLKLNSAAGVQDGIYQHWLDGEKLVSMNQIAWIGTNGNMNAQWNSIAIGGNNYYKFDLVGTPQQRERWYAIDDIEVYSALPEGY